MVTCHWTHRRTARGIFNSEVMTHACSILSERLLGLESRLFVDTCGTTSILSDKTDPSELETGHSLPDSKLAAKLSRLVEAEECAVVPVPGDSATLFHRLPGGPDGGDSYRADTVYSKCQSVEGGVGVTTTEITSVLSLSAWSVDAVISDAEVLDSAHANVRPRTCAGDDGVICCAGNRDSERLSSAGSDSLVAHTGFFDHFLPSRDNCSASLDLRLSQIDISEINKG